MGSEDYAHSGSQCDSLKLGIGLLSRYSSEELASLILNQAEMNLIERDPHYFLKLSSFVRFEDQHVILDACPGHPLDVGESKSGDTGKQELPECSLEVIRYLSTVIVCPKLNQLSGFEIDNTGIIGWQLVFIDRLHID